MKDETKSKEQLIKEIGDLRKQVSGLSASESSIIRSVIDGIADPILVIDAQSHKIIMANKTAQHFAGTNDRGIGDMTCYEALHHSQHPCRDAVEKCPLDIVKATKAPARITHTHRDSNNEAYIMDIIATPVFGKDGEVVQIIESCRDVTESKKMETAVKESEEKYRKLFHHSNDAIIIHDTDGNVIDANQSAVDTFGYDETELLTVNISELHSPDELEKYRYAYQKLARDSFVNFEITLRKKSGDIFPAEVSSSIFEIGGKMVIQGIVRDITERKQLEERLHIMSVTDSLTGLYNRRGFFFMAKQQLKAAKRMGKDIILISADLDNLKGINDTYGHKEGDAALTNTANILKESFRESDVIARIGGDEFVVLQVESANTAPDQLDARLHNNLKAHNRNIDPDYDLSVSIGIVHYKTDSVPSIDTMLAAADTLMYEQKKNKRSQS